MTRALALLATLVLGATLSVTMHAPAQAEDLPPLMLSDGDANVSNIGDQAIIRTSKFGYVYIAGKQDTDLTVTYLPERNALRYRDLGTKRLTKHPKGCREQNVRRGISAVCRIPARFYGKNMFVQVWPRLGNDHVDGRTLPRRFRLWVLADAGRDIVHGGAGSDFVNGARGRDRAYGNGGNDWLRGGKGVDRLRGGPGKDRISHGT